MNPQRNTIALAMLLMLASLVAACGNKGPLVKPNATSQPTPATTPATPAKPAATDGS
jgi:predicted small lipoprotein YifL